MLPRILPSVSDFVVADQKTLREFRAAALRTGLVSFDLFDTLLVRNFIQPMHVFDALSDHMAATAPEFAEWFRRNRNDAQWRVWDAAKLRGEGEITLAQVYDELRKRSAAVALPGGIGLDTVMQLECAFEIACISADARTKAVFDDLVRQGRRVILVSDMYLPLDCIEAMLKKTGIEGYFRLYLSSVTGAPKADGTAWPLIRADLKLSKSTRIVHLGDNPVIDGKTARRHGIKSFLLTEPSLRMSPMAHRPTGHWLHDICHALLLQRLAGHRDDSGIDPYWLAIAYLIVVPAAIGMAGFVKQVAGQHGTGAIFFLARDGLIFQKAYEAAWRSPDATPSRYVWCSRRCLNIAMIDELTGADVDFLVSGELPMTVADYVARIDLDPEDERVQAALLKHFPAPLELASTSEAKLRLREMFVELAEPIRERAQFERTGLLAHLDDVGLFDGPAVVVDLGWRGTLQRSLINLGAFATGELPAIAGAYFGTIPDRVRSAGGEPMAAYGWMFEDGEPEQAFRRTVAVSNEIVELLFSAPESGIRFVEMHEGRPAPVLIEQQEEQPRLQLAKIFHDAVEHAGSVLRPHLQPEHVAGLREMALLNLSTLLASPGMRDAKKFSGVPYAEGFGTALYRQIIPAGLGFSQPRALLRAYHDTFWRAGLFARVNPALRLMIMALVRLETWMK